MVTQKNRKNDQPSIKIRNGVLITVISAALIGVIGGLAKFTYEANSVYALKTEVKEVGAACPKKESVDRILMAVDSLAQEQRTLTGAVNTSIQQSSVNTAKIEGIEKTLDRHLERMP